jgi:hypothetical protein
LESDVTKNESVVVHSPETDPSLNDASPTYITIETTDGQLEHVKVKKLNRHVLFCPTNSFKPIGPLDHKSSQILVVFVIFTNDILVAKNS